MQNQISLSIPVEQEQAILAKIEELKALLPTGLITLTEEEKHAMPKMGDKTVAFVEKCIDSAARNAAVLPSFVNLDELKKDFNSHQALNHIIRALNQVAAPLFDSALLAGSEAYTASLSIYNLAKDAGHRDVPGAKEIASELSARFPGRSKNVGEQRAKN